MPPREPCIVVNPTSLRFDVRIRLEADSRVILFDDLDALDRWRSRCTNGDGLTCEVTTALHEIGLQRASLPHDLACVLERVSRRTVTPTVHDLVALACSERTFYRHWNAAVPVRPKLFLDRVRFLHALRLIERLGYSAKEAASLAGYGSPDMFRALMRRQKTTSFGRDSVAGAR